MWVFLLIIWIITTSVSGYAIEGSWKVVDILDITLPEGHLIKADIKNFIFRNSNIRWTITFTGCQSFKYMMQVRDNNLYIDLNTFYVQNKNVQNCSEQKLIYQKKLQNAIKKTFSFKMIYFLMAFSDPEGNPVVKFERILNNSTDKNKLNGAWMLNALFSTKLAELIEINDKKIIFCQKEGQADYKLAKNKLQITGSKAKTCKNQDLLKAFNGTLYYVKRNQTLQLYNPTDQLVMSLNYITDLQGLKKLRQQQQKQKKINPQPPITNRIQPLVKSQQLPPPKSTQIDLPIQKYFGKWSVARIFGQPNIVKKTQLIISNNTLIISHECMTFIQSFITQSLKPFVIKRRTLRQMPTPCKSQDNSLYKTAITKVSALNLSIQGNLLVIRTYDNTGKEVFTLTKPNDIVQPIQSLISPIPPPPPIQPFNFNPSPMPPVLSPPSIKRDPNLLQQGKYTILLLMRRQIPRKIVTLRNNSFTFTFCNQYRVTLRLSNKKQIKIITERIKSNTCDLGAQNLFLDFFNKAVNYYHDDQETVIIKDKDNKEIITFNFVG